MTLYELTDNITLQGNIEIKIFNEQGNEEETRCYRDNDGFHCTCDDADDIEDLEVTYIYSTTNYGTGAWTVIEVIREEDQD